MSLILVCAEALDIIFICFVLFFERKESSKRVLWLFILAFIPVLGVIFYLLGSGHFFTGSFRMRLTNRLVSQYKKNVLKQQLEFIEEREEKISNEVLKKNISLIKMNLQKGESTLSSASSVHLYTSIQEVFDKMCLDISNAKKSIYLEYFIFHDDKIGNRIMDLLCQKAQEGVEVKLLYDDLGSLFSRLSFFRRLDKAGGKSRPFFQLRVGLPLTINYRNHRKLTIIDGKTGWIGGYNIGDEYANMSEKCKLNWRDTAVRVEGDVCMSMHALFMGDWYSATAWKIRKRQIQRNVDKYFPPMVFNDITGIFKNNSHDLSYVTSQNSSAYPCQILTSDPNGTHEANIEDAFINIISKAKKYVYIQTPYFAPDESFVSCLKMAAFNGLDVRVQIPRDWDKFYVKAASCQFVRELQLYGIKFYMYPGFIHAKTITCDDSVFSLGSTNIDCRSFNLHFECNVIFYDERIVTEHKKIFLEDEKKSHFIKLGEFNRKPFFIRAWWSFAKLFGPLM